MDQSSRFSQGTCVEQLFQAVDEGMGAHDRAASAPAEQNRGNRSSNDMQS